MNALSEMLASLVLAAALLPAPSFAQVPDRVGRIAYLAGQVQFYSETGQGWGPAELNAPVTSRNSLYTGSDGRAEIRFGSAAVSMESNTQLDFQVLDDESFRARVGRGSVSLRVPQFDFNETVEVAAGHGRYTLQQAGRYRIDADESGSAIAVFSGSARASLPGNEVSVEAGRSLSANIAGYQFGSAVQTSLDLWGVQRDAALRFAQATRYVSPNMTGYEELDANGRWESDPDYGTVWYPTTYVSPGWAPYRDGRWAYVAPWGWTWIDAAPWGFAPFHYGRWVRIGPSWAWTPGSYIRRPSYAPALVAFVGGVPGATFAVGARPSVSWYPLPPWESYRPAYRHPGHHLHNINSFTVTEAPSHAVQIVESQRISNNQLHGKTEAPHAAFFESRPLARVNRPPIPANVQESGARGRPESARTPLFPEQPSGVPEGSRHNLGEGSAARPARNAVEPPSGAVPGSERRPPPGVSETAAPERIEAMYPPPAAFRRSEGGQRGALPGNSANPAEPRFEHAIPQNRFGGGGFGVRPELPQPKPAEIAPPKMRSEPGYARPEPPRTEFQNRQTVRPAELPSEQRREREKERSGPPEHGRGREPWAR
ncbi:MAG: hypothetical protein HY777_06680 [Betaproteobacteria bacterium]|nr:hypothetical protein [Betaproteobacteria bacterium]